MNSKIIKFLLALFLGFAFFLGSAYAEGDDGQKSNTLNKPGSPIRAYMNINFISTVIKNTGISDIDPVETNSGLVYPKGSGKTAVFQSGFVWGAIVDDPDIPNVGGSTYREGLQGGQINSDGTFPDPNSPGVRIFRVRPDARPGLTTDDVDVSSEAQDEVKSEADVLAQYQLDWQEWPATLGAPYTDVDENGSYDPTVDIPGVPGADQTIWFVANDQESGLTQNLYGTLPMGIEMQATFWAYAQTGALGNMFFRRYLITNKTDVLPSGPKTFEDMYVCMWSDPDVGNSTDDFAGSDTLLSLVYAYNGIANDPTYSPLPPPAVGFDFFQGPIVESPGDSAIFKGEYIQGYKNLPMTAAFYFTRGDATVTDPVLGSPTEGAVRFYRFMQGRVGLTDLPFIDPTTGEPTKFVLNGDPVAKTGWIDGLVQAPGDRRIGAASGPFDMAPGDEQEIVVAEICGGAVPGVDRISAVALMKFYDQVAQVAYDNFFDLPTPPPAPSVTTAVLDGEVILDWSKDKNKVNATETSNIKGYTFQGYNVYQLPSASANISEGVRVATYDVADGIGKINDLVFDPTTGSVVTLPVQFGNDTGIKRYISITQDAINQRPLINGIRYYFAVTAYNYNLDPLAVPNNLENPLQILTLIPQSNNPGVTLGEGHGEEVQITHDGTADGGPIVTIVDPTATTGNEYEVFFTERAEIRDENGDWVAASTVIRKMGPNGPDGLDTLTGSSVDISSVYSPQSGVVELMCFFNYVSSDGNWADGIEMDFPPGMDIVDFPTFDAGGGTVEPIITGDPSTGLHVEMGDVSGVLSEDGVFHGGEEWSIFVATFEPPQSIDWEIWDDGWSGGAVNAVGTTTLDEIGFASRLAKYWNLQDVTAGTLKLENQSLINGVDIFPDRDDIPTDLGVDASPIVDGFQINVDVGYEAPLTISANNPPLLNGEDIFTFSGSDVWWTSDNFTICDFTRFGYPDGTAATSLPLYGGAGGTSDVNVLQQDYEFRWTGIQADTVIGGRTITYTPSGGSIITLFGASGYDLIDHPLNTTGAEQPITVRVPFEVWNLDNDEQVNVVFWDRSGVAGDLAEDSAAVWNQFNREYIWIVNTPYSEDLIDVTSQTVADNATWVWGPYLSTLSLGDVVRINYDNPIQIGTDTYSFMTTAPSYSSNLAKDQVNEINVFPNPYYGINTEELNKYNRFVTFTHMPEQAKVRIFNLAGVLVRTLDKEDPGQFLRWDLANEDGLPVASGLYIAYIELPELGTTKILKLAIIQEQQVLDRF